jgi:RNA polymerase sigma-70 factor (ECF subfamily)
VSVTPDLDVADSVWRVRRAIDSLPPKLTEVVRMQHLDGMTHVEIAEKLGVALGTVKSRSHRAHRVLASQLQGLR